MKKIIRVDVFRGIFSKYPVDTLYQIVKGEGKTMNEYCINDECKNKNKCPIHHYINKKVTTNKFFWKKYNPETCKYNTEGKNGD